MKLTAYGLACVRGSRGIFENVDFEVGAGEALIVEGPNGAGKTSLLRLIAGLLRPAAGRLALDAGDPQHTLGEQAHFLGHQDALKPSLSVLENLRFWASYLGAPGLALPQALQAVGLDGLADLPAGYLSAGQRRRLAISRLIAAKRPIWLLDEPASALDKAGQGRLAELMKAHLRDGGLIVAATHGPLGIERTKHLRLGGRREGEQMFS